MPFPSFALAVVLFCQTLIIYWHHQTLSSSRELTQFLLEKVNENQRRVALLCGEKTMPRVQFTRDWDFHINELANISCKAGATYVLTEAQAAQAVSDKAGELVRGAAERRSAASAAPANGNPDDEGR